MKVTVTFGDTSVVVPCKSGWTVRDLIDQATRRYRRILEQHGESAVKTHHLEYAEGGILDMDDMLSDLVEDRDKLVAIFDEVHAVPTASPSESMFNGNSSSTSPEPLYYFPDLDNKESIKGEIEVNEAILKANTPLLVRSSSDSALVPPLQTAATPTPEENGSASLEPEPTNGRRGDLNPLHTDGPRAKMNQVDFRTLTRTVKFPGDWGPLGIHVVPYCSSLSGRTLGLHIKGIEEDSLAKKQKLFQEDECIVQINDIPLQDKTFAQSQDVFRQAMATPSVHLEVLSVPNKTPYEKSLIGQLFTGDGRDLSAKTKSPMSLRVKANLQPEPKGDKLHTKLEVRQPDMRSKTPEPESTSPPPALQSGQDSQERVSQTAPESTTRASPTPKARSQSPLATRSPIIPGLPNLTTKRGGKRIKIDLKKGAEGLGFTVVTRDSSVHGPGPILVKNILQRGAAVKDGRLQPGDRILEVNGVDMTGRSQEELVAMLRSTKQGECVYMVVARQEELFLPRELKGEEARSLVLEDGREQLMYEIPLNETGSAGLGVSLKGNKSRETGEDLGIFIKSIIHGGAAYKDGRLSVNDQLLAINGESLLGRSNHAAMETLRHSMSSEANSRGTIQLVVLRAPRQLASTNPRPSTTVSGSTANQPSTTMSLNQVRVGDPLQQPQQPPTPPRRSSSFIPMQRWRASELLPHSYTTHVQKPVETNPRYNYNFSQSQRHGCYIGGVIPRQYCDDQQNNVYTAAVWYDAVFPPHGQNLSGYKRPTAGNINRESYGYGSTQSRAPAYMQDHATLQNMHREVFHEAQGNTGSQRLRHTRSHTLDSIHTRDGYTENIRAMAGQMYGDSPSHRTPTQTDVNRNAHTAADTYAHSHNYTHNRALTRHHHLRLSGGL